MRREDGGMLKRILKVDDLEGDGTLTRKPAVEV